MSRTQPKSSPMDRHARRIAAAIAKGQPPALTPDLDLYLESSPREIFGAFEGVARHMPPGGDDETLALGYLFLLQQLLERLRYRTDCGYADATRLIADFQADVAARVEAGHIDRRMLAYVGGALHQSKIPASPELAKASARQHVNDREGWPVPDDVHAALAGLVEACGDDPFMLVGSLGEFSHAMPAENRGAVAAGLALCGASATRGAAVLLLLDPDRVVRRTVAEALATVASALSPTEVRRLVAMRAEIPAAMRGGTAVETVLRKSDELADLEAVAQSWFEEGPDIARAIAGARARNRAKVVTYLLQSVIARHRDKWADLLLRTALWMREAPLELDLCWRELAIVAKALADGRDMAEIGLMRDIAQRTLAVLANDERM